MNKYLAIILSATLACMGWLSALATQPQSSIDDDEYVRQNPDMGQGETEVPREHGAYYSQYPYLHLGANHINLNGADWDGLRGRFAACGDTVISIVHIGDSHIQAEGSTSRTRALLQERYGSAGRGLIAPLRLAGTNQPRDYSITSESEFETAKLLKQPWPVEMGFTGVAIQPSDREFDITILVKPQDDREQDFDFVRMFTHGHMPLLRGANTQGERALFSEVANADTLTIFLYEPATEITLEFEAQGRCQIFGFQLENQMTGVEYSAIGNNGATYSSYNAIGTMGSDVRALSPSLIIISLGANEAFGSITDQAFYNNIDVLVRNLHRENPEALVLLTTPAECQRSSTVRRGKKRRRTKTYSVNTNIERLRNVILRYGRDKGIATYDWYEVAGGRGSSAHWLDDGLMNTDRIHNTWDGYDLQGTLFYDALIDAIDK